jgi:two-component system response regulator YesN
MKPNRYKSLFTSNFAEYFYYFLGLSLLITFLLGGSLYYSSASILREEAITNNNNSLILLKNAQELVLSEVDKSMGNIFLDSFYSSYMDYYYNQDIITLQQLQKKLDDVLSTNSYIDSVYIYYHQDKFVLSSAQGPVRIEDFDDKQFAEQLTVQTFDKNYVKTRTVKKYLQPNQTVITMVKAIPLNFMNQPTAYVVINIKGVYLQQMIDSIKTNANSGIIVADQKGNIITQKAGTQVKIQNAAEYMEMSIGKASGFNVKKIEGINTLVSYVSSEKYGWIYIYTIPMSVVTHKIQLWIKTALLVSLFVILLSLFCSILFSKRIFSPLKRMLSLLNKDVADGDKPGQRALKEIKQIERNVTRILDKNKDLEMLLQDYEIYSRNKFLNTLVSLGEEVNQKTYERIAYYGLNLIAEGYYVTCLLSMDDYTKFSNDHSEKVRNTLFLKLTESLSDEILQSNKGFIVEVDTNLVVLVLNFDTFLQVDEVKHMSDIIAKDIHLLMARYDPYTFTIGVSTPFQGIGHIHDSYYEASAAVDYRMILGNNHLILYESMEKSEKHISYPLSIERNILNSLKLGDSRAVTLYFAEFEAYIHQNASDHIEMVRNFFLQLFSSSIKCIYEMDSDFELRSLLHNVKHTDLLNEETMRGMVAYMAKVYDQIIGYLETKRSLKNQALVLMVKEFITNNMGFDLSQERLSDQFYISTSYLRKIFKDETGETIKDFIHKERMNKAKNLLENADLKISDIAEQIGYLSAQSFSKAFKIEVGKTPGVFREEHQRGLMQRVPTE